MWLISHRGDVEVAQPLLTEVLAAPEVTEKKITWLKKKKT